MKFNLISRGALALATLLLLLAAIGCEKKGHIVAPTNVPPTIELTAAPVSTTDTSFYAYRMDWSGNDPDGRIDHYGYAVDPPRQTPANPHPDTAWVATTKNEQVMFFKSTQPIANKARWAIDHHVFAIRAYDNRGASSLVVSREFTSYTISPTVNVTSPVPKLDGIQRVTPSVRIHWAGIDPDGQFSQKPVKYKYKLFPQGDANFGVNRTIADVLSDPQSFRQTQAAKYFADWDSVGGDTTTVQYTGLLPTTEYLFVVIGFDEAGAYNADWSGAGNMLDFVVGYAGALGPVITAWNEFFSYTMPTGGFNTSLIYDLEIPAMQQVTFNWFATTTSGADISWYRWRVNGNVDDETPRTNEQTDWAHWSQKSLSILSATIGPYLTTDNQYLYIEAEDNNGMRSLLTIRIHPIVPLMNDPVNGKNLLVVNDTRLEPDKFNIGGTQQLDYTAKWPAAAELDTFLFARGGTPWQPTAKLPNGSANPRFWFQGTVHPSYVSTTPPGIFSGYNFDTLGTRQGFENATAGVPFSLLSQYRHIVWLTDQNGAVFSGPPTQATAPQSTLHFMNTPGHANTFATYAYAGGKVWLAGGGGAFASLEEYNAKGAKNNDGKYGVTARKVFSSDPSVNELISGRMMYDGAHWQSELIYQVAASLIYRSPHIPAVARPTPGWKFADPNHSPNYALFPAQMRTRGTTTSHLAEDSLPPTRQQNGNGQSQFYPSVPNAIPVEYLSQANYIIEDVDPDPVNVKAASTLDTLMYLRGGSLANTGYEPVTMTWYHGVAAPEFVFSGFAIWDWARRDCQTLTDFVLQQMWGMTRSSTNSTPALASRPVVPPSAVRPVVTSAPARARVPVGRATGR